VLFLAFATFSVGAQTPLEQAFNQLQKGSEFPEELQSTRSAVFLKVAVEGPNSKKSKTKLLAERLHKDLLKGHIDAVAYYRWQDLNTGLDATESYLETIRAREIKQIVFLISEAGNFQIYIIPTGEDPGLFAVDKKSWHTSGNSMEEVLGALNAAVRRHDLEIANFLISDTPEYFVDTEVFTKNRFESFQPDLKLDKLAVPLFTGIDPENIEEPEDQTLQAIVQAKYPFNYELVRTDLTEDLMKKAGFHYVLRYLHGEEATLMTLLDYRETATNPEKMGYKFYMKHLVTGDIYLGNTWDIQTNWQAALNKHLTNLRQTLKVE